MTEEELQVDNTKQPFFIIDGDELTLNAMQLENGLFIAIYQQEKARMGTVALCVPMTKSLVEAKLEKRRITSTTVFGSRNEIYAKALAEKVTINTGMINYLSINFQDKEEKHFTEAIQLIEKLIDEIK